jgi:fatty acid desaturase
VDHLAGVERVAGLVKYWVALGWPAMFVYGVFLTVPAYSMSHETAHGTAFRTRWLNEVVLWVTSLIYVEEPLHRRYTHTNHHTYTWHVGKDSQMPFDTPMTLGGWVQEITGLALARFHAQVLFQLAFGQVTEMQKQVIPAQEMPKLVRNARIFLAIYSAIPVLVLFGFMAPIWFFVLPRILGAPVMLLFTLIQHVEMQENSPSIIKSTRSFRTNWLGRFLYMDMNNHVEHHLYPQVPFYRLPDLNTAVSEQLPDPDPGFVRTNIEVLSVVFRRSLGRNTKARTIRQAPHHVTDGKFESIAKATM